MVESVPIYVLLFCVAISHLILEYSFSAVLIFPTNTWVWSSLSEWFCADWMHLRLCALFLWHRSRERFCSDCAHVLTGGGGMAALIEHTNDSNPWIDRKRIGAHRYIQREQIHRTEKQLFPLPWLSLLLSFTSIYHPVCWISPALVAAPPPEGL